MSKKKTKKATTSSSTSSSLPSSGQSPISIPPPSSEPSSPYVPLPNSDLLAIRALLGDTYDEYHAACTTHLSDPQNTTLLHLARFFRAAYDLAWNRRTDDFRELRSHVLSMAKDREEAKSQGVEEEKLRWVNGGHIADGACTANKRECKSVNIETEPIPSPSIPLSPAVATAAVQTDNHIEESMPISWADEVDATVPICISTSTPIPSSLSRDLSALRSQPVKPFASLQRRRIAHRLGHHSKSPRSKYPNSMLPVRRHSTSHTPSQATHSPNVQSQSRSRYDWTANLFILSDLANALGQMGWKPPDFLRVRH